MARIRGLSVSVSSQPPGDNTSTFALIVFSFPSKDTTEPTKVSYNSDMVLDRDLGLAPHLRHFTGLAGDGFCCGLKMTPKFFPGVCRQTTTPSLRNPSSIYSLAVGWGPLEI
jgi:hypothetical protein